MPSINHYKFLSLDPIIQNTNDMKKYVEIPLLYQYIYKRKLSLKKIVILPTGEN